VGIAAQFCSPQGITVAPSGDIVVADTNNLALRRIRVSGSNASPTYTVTTVTTGGLTGVSAVQADSAGNIYVALSAANRIMMWSPTLSALQNVAGTGQGSDANNYYNIAEQPQLGDVTTIRLSAPTSLALAPDGTLYTNDNGIIRAVGPQATA